MPFVNVKVIRGVFTPDQKQQMIAKKPTVDELFNDVTRALV